MIDWSRGGFTGSLNNWVRREVREHLRDNVAARRSRYGLFERILRQFFSIETFGRFIGLYVACNLAALLAEVMVAKFAAGWLPAWTNPTTELKALLLNVSSYLITAQVGVLGVISLALALVTLIVQAKDSDSSTDVRIYYHQSLAFQVVASCIALLIVLCAQLLWPTQFLLHRFEFGTDLQFFKLCLLGVHLLWLCLNLAALAHFIATTFGFVQQSARETLRERYTANVVLPSEMTAQLRQQLYGAEARKILSEGKKTPDDPRAEFGFDFGSPFEVEVQSTFSQTVALYDVRMVYVRWVLCRWALRCNKAAAKTHRSGRRGQSLAQHPMIWFTLEIDAPIKGEVTWCRRRGGVPLVWFEKSLLRSAFRFRRVTDGS